MRQDISQKVAHDDTDLFRGLAIRVAIEGWQWKEVKTMKIIVWLEALKQISLSKSGHGQNGRSQMLLGLGCCMCYSNLIDKTRYRAAPRDSPFRHLHSRVT